MCCCQIQGWAGQDGLPPGRREGAEPRRADCQPNLGRAARLYFPASQSARRRHSDPRREIGPDRRSAAAHAPSHQPTLVSRIASATEVHRAAYQSHLSEHSCETSKGIVRHEQEMLKRSGQWSCHNVKIFSIGCPPETASGGFLRSELWRVGQAAAGQGPVSPDWDAGGARPYCGDRIIPGRERRGQPFIPGPADRAERGHVHGGGHGVRLSYLRDVRVCQHFQFGGGVSGSYQSIRYFDTVCF